MQYAELHANSYFSLLGASSSPEALVETASELQLPALALTDHDSLAGAVRFTQAAKRANLHGILGSEITMADGCQLTLLAEDQTGYTNLCRLISASRLDHLSGDTPWMGKVDAKLSWERLAQHTTGLIALTGGITGPVTVPLLRDDPEGAQRTLTNLRARLTRYRGRNWRFHARS